MKKVLIVGASQVGLIIGCYLNKYGIDFDIIDKNTHSTTWSKALSVSPATIKAFHRLSPCRGADRPGQAGSVNLRLV